MEQKKRSPILAIALAVVIGLMVIALLNGFIRPTDVVVAKVAVAPGTILTADLVELRSIPAGAKPTDAFTRLEDVQGKMLAVGRAPGDFILSSVLGEASAAGIPSELEPGHVALAVNVDLASGVAGLLRPGQTVTIIGMLTPDVMGEAVSVMPAPYPEDMGLTPVGQPAIPTPTPTPAPPAAPLARLAVSGLRVLMVPQSFRYEELPAGSSEEQLYSSARTTMAAQGSSVIVLDVPTNPVEVAPGLRANPASILAALNKFGALHLALEPAAGLQNSDIVTLNLGDLYESLNEGRGKEDR
jgi:Flp pilus assembly protein CpaB